MSWPTDGPAAACSSYPLGTTYVQALPLNVIGGNLVLTASNGVELRCQ